MFIHKPPRRTSQGIQLDLLSMKFLHFYFLWAITFGTSRIRIYSGSATLKSKHEKRVEKALTNQQYRNQSKMSSPKKLTCKAGVYQSLQTGGTVRHIDIFDPIFSTVAPLTFSLVQLSPPPFPVSKYSLYRQCVAGRRWGGVESCWRPYSAGL